MASDDGQVSQADFAALLKRAAHDRQAQEQLCQHYAPQVRIIARVLLGPALRPHFDSLDLVQSVHRSLLLGLQSDKFDISTPQKLVALASTMVRRKVARKWRKQRRQVSSGGSVNLVETLNSLSSTETDPAKAAEFSDQLQQLCENLNETERRMLELRLEGFTSGEVAERLGLHAVALRVRWTRLRKRLQDSGVVADWL